MAGFFESALLFSLAVLIVLVGLLVYYFKGQLASLEEKNMKCLEIIGDVYKAHLELKTTVEDMNYKNLLIAGSIGNRRDLDPNLELRSDFNPINMEIKEWTIQNMNEDNQKHDDESDYDYDDDDVDDNISVLQFENEDQDQYADKYDDSNTKKIKVDLQDLDPVECIDISDVDDQEKAESDDAAIDNVVLDYEDMQFHNHAEPKHVVQKTEESIEVEKQPITVDEKRDYKKMTLPELRGYIISNGIHSDSSKLKTMKKNELIELILAADSE